MMETAQARAGKHRRFRTGLGLNRPASRRILAETVVNAVLVKIGNVITHQASQMLFVQRNHMVEYFSATAAHPSFGDSVLPRRWDAGPLRLQTRCF